MERLITNKITRLNEYVNYLKALKDIPLKTLEEDFKVKVVTERYLHLAIESIIDIGNEIISIRHLKRPEQYRNIPEILAESGIIPQNIAKEIVKMIGFRNLLVYNYAVINVALEYEFLETRLQDFEEFMRYIAKWLKNG